MNLKVIIFLLLSTSLFAQEQAVVFGVISDLDTEQFVDFVTVFIKGSSNATESDSDGNFRLEVDPNKLQTIVFSRLGYAQAEISVPKLDPGSKRYLKVKLAPQETDIGIVIRDSKIEDVGIVREEVTDFLRLPTTSGNFESVLPNIALGVSSGTGGELSSQYNVRGGNYDENLVYVNDFEIFRPQLIRSSQQEGLSFPNIDLIRDLSFSSGGFEAKYGDKLSSVLDIRYKRPEEFKASVNASLLGASAHMEGSKRLGANAYNKLRYLVGARYKTTNYLLTATDITGEYVPNFTDIQSYITYDFTPELQVSLLGNFNRNLFNFIPATRNTTTGLINQTIQFSVLYEGQEVTGFTNAMGGLALTYIPKREKNPVYFKFLSSIYGNREIETFDILGFYRLSEIETDISEQNNGEEIAVLGVGTTHDFGRNSLYSRIQNFQHKGGIELQKHDKAPTHFIQWSGKVQQEFIDDRIHEFERLDSAGYSIPYNEFEVQLNNVLQSTNELLTYRYSAYVQDTYNKVFGDEEYELSLNAGVRATYWDLNKETNISPRGQVLFRPLKSKTNITYKLAGGVYYQPPFYREMRRNDGTVNTDLESQKSLHIIAGIQKDLIMPNAGKKPFKLISEIYYKRLTNLVSYELDNVQIRYSGENDAEGYVWGWDLRINGEFVPGTESWFNISILQAKESLIGVQHMERELGQEEGTPVQWVSRPTDQLMNIAIYFQDYLPRNENFKFNGTMSFASGLPFGIQGDNQIYRNTYQFKPYLRADLGFLYLIFDESRRKKKPNHILGFTKETWISLEVFNLMNVQNVSSNTWIKSIGLSQYAVPNFLTSRRVNLRFRMDF